jgi:DNA-binding transcriptional ArsR family regulator
MKYRKRRFANRRRRERFIMIPRDLLVHPDWTHRPAAARVIFVDMCKIHHHGSERGPSNNGRIGYGCAAGAKATNMSVATAYRMLKELRESGLLELRREGAFRVKAGDGRAAEWEITIYPVAGRASKPWGERRLHIEHWLLDCAAYKGLSNQAKCILIELMRRHDGGNNGSISFGGADGACAGFSTDVTERALTELERAGFLVQTAPAVPHLSHPRKWRLTMYEADRKSPTKDFMSDSRPSAEKSYSGFTGAGKSPKNVSMMRVPSRAVVPEVHASVGEVSNDRNELDDPLTNLATRVGETLATPDIRTSETHLEASPPAAGRLPVCEPVGAPSAQGYIKATKPADPAVNVSRAQPSPVARVVEPGDLFGGVLQSVPSPHDELRLELRAKLSQQRGTQSRLAEAVGLSRSTFAHALSGRAGFTPTAAAALRRWLDGEPLAGDWPTVPAAPEDKNAA